jgi:hypothetical protein
MKIKSALLYVPGRLNCILAWVVRWGGAVAISVSLVTTGMAQVPSATTAGGAKPQQPFTIPDSIVFDAARQGPLLWVLVPITWRPGLSEATPDAASVAAHVDKMRLRVVSTGSVTVLAPRSMYILEENPGRPDPYSGLRAEERLKVLMSWFTADQWGKAGSADGIGAADLNEQERALFYGLLPDKLVVQSAKLAPGDQPNSTRYDYQGGPQEFAPSDVHLRFVRQVHFGFLKPGTNDTAAMSSPSPQVGDEITVLQTQQVTGDATDPNVVKAYGVPIMTVVPSKLKTGQLDFAAPQLLTAIPIDDSSRTLGDLLAQVARATGLDLVVDRRLAKLRVAWRAMPGQSARAGDILKALCWSITGAFRRLREPGGASTYLLTDDVRGIGTRIAHLNDWAEEANRVRAEALGKLAETTAANNPLSHIKFAPGDGMALSPALEQQVDAAYRAERGSPTVAFSDLPSALQESVEQGAQFWADNKIAVRRDRLQIDTGLKVEYKLPGDLAVDAPFSQNLHFQYLQSLARKTKKTPTGTTTGSASTPPPLPESLRRRVVMAQLPEQSQAVADLLTAAKGAGFTEIWLQAMLNDPAIPGRLNHAVAVGRRIGIGVGCAVSLLRKGGFPGRDDVNILGETGAEFASRKAAEIPAYADFYNRMDGWCLLEPYKAARLLLPLTRVPGLSALTVRATAAPGYAGESPGGDGISYGGHLGYGLTSRLACLRAQGFDPIDIAPYSYALGVPLQLPFFESYNAEGTGANARRDCWKDLCDYRLQENRHGLMVIYAALKQVAPDLPLYLSDRVSDYADPNTSWYSLWDAAEHIPVNPVYSADSGGREAAFATSPEPFLNRNGWNGDPVALARALGRMAPDATKNWHGLTLNLVELKPLDALRMLKGLQTLYAHAGDQ